MSPTPGNAKRRQRASTKAGLGSWDIELKLTRADLDAMPAGLRHQLLTYLETRMGHPESEEAGSRLERQQVAALLRELSFHKAGRSLRALLDCLAYDNDADAPTRQKLAAALPASDRMHVVRYINMLNRLAAKAAKTPDAQIARIQSDNGVYTADRTTRRWLRELLPGIERAGENEEPLWG